MRSTSHLSPAERDWISGFLANEPWFDFYWRCSLDDLDRGIDNRSVLVGRRRRGVVLGIRFDAVSVFSTVGELDGDELESLLEPAERIELHLREPEWQALTGLAA